ncbi:uncharacterized protein LOC123309633 [Coccinella septempunctata]|uniref:uncharacterized protein LOC123309633 n=1 Tax=Coccinella septempunctata TaxID=41139 RepID=UPI001D07878E|nr:uncharacterized protein LOC123309633 [Coccinella septempunctata]
MNSTPWFILIAFLHMTSSRPQSDSYRIPNVDFSSAEEINGLEPSPIPGLENRSFNNNGNFLEATLEEVQNILKASPDLPRLTKGEILDLIENITKQDMEKLRALNKNRTGKSVLLVMPYSPKKNGENMEDLYTKKPVTQLIDNDNATVEIKKTNKNKKPSFNFKKDSTRIFGRNVTKTSYKLTFPPTPPTEPTSEIPYDTTSPMTNEASTVEVTTFRRRVRPPRTRPPTTTRPTTTRPTRRRRRPTVTPYNTVKDHQDQLTSRTDKFLPENAIRVTRPPVFRYTRRTTTTTELPDLSIAESYQDYVYANPPPELISLNQYGPSVSPFATQDELTRPGPVFKPISNQLFTDDDLNSPPKTSTFKPFPASFVIPEGFEHIFRDLNLDSPQTKEKLLEESVRSNQPRTTTTTTEFPIPPVPEFGEVADNLSPEMKSLLMTFGLIPNPEEKRKVRKEEIPYTSGGIEDKPESYTGFKPLPENGAPNEELDSLLASFGLGRNARRSKKIGKRVDTSPGLDLSVVPESMMGIVRNLGLSNEIPITEKAYVGKTTSSEPTRNERIDDFYENDIVSADDISEINQLPNDNVTDVEPSEKNSTDSASVSVDTSTYSVEPIDDPTYSEENSTYSEAMKDLDISTTEQPDPQGMDDINSTTIEPQPDNNTNEILINEASKNVEHTETTTKATSTSVVFNPTDQKIVQKEKEQLDKLVELIKALKRINGSATEEDFKNFDLETLKEFTKVLNESQRTAFREQIENEINPLNSFEDNPRFKPKRQEMTTEQATTEETTESKIEPNFLEDSFGKLPEEEIETPTTRTYPSGVYYLIDWNTFLEVDNTKGTHVNLRFQPKVGDPGRFYAINNN